MYLYGEILKLLCPRSSFSTDLKSGHNCHWLNLKVQSCKLCQNKYLITSIQITNA